MHTVGILLCTKFCPSRAMYSSRQRRRPPVCLQDCPLALTRREKLCPIDGLFLLIGGSTGVYSLAFTRLDATALPKPNPAPVTAAFPSWRQHLLPIQSLCDPELDVAELTQPWVGVAAKSQTSHKTVEREMGAPENSEHGSRRNLARRFPETHAPCPRRPGGHFGPAVSCRSLPEV